MTLYIAADVKSEDGTVWEVIGVFESAALAAAACTALNHCYWSLTLNERQPDDSTVPPDVCYPRYEEQQAVQ